MPFDIVAARVEISLAPFQVAFLFQLAPIDTNVNHLEHCVEERQQQQQQQRISQPVRCCACVRPSVYHHGRQGGQTGDLGLL